MSKENKPFDFLPYCQKCPRSEIHCCTKKGNTVIVNKTEKDKIQQHFDRLINEKKISIPDNVTQYSLFKEIEGSTNISELELIRIKDENVEYNKCPFFDDRDNKSLCLIHYYGKPIDCQLWPIAKFENGDKGVIFFDSKCSAVNDKQKIPLSEIEKDLILLDSLNEDEKKAYYTKNNLHYELNGVSRELWDDYQELKGSFKSGVADLEIQFKVKLDAFEKKHIPLDFDIKKTTKITSGLIYAIFGFIIAVVLVSQILSYNIDPTLFNNKTFFEEINVFIGNNFNILILFVLVLMIITDVYRMVLPLPWIIKAWDEDTEFNSFTQKNKYTKKLPRGEIYKLLKIGAPTIILLIALSIGFITNPTVYLFIFSFVLLLDLFWYPDPNPGKKTERNAIEKEYEVISHEIESQFSHLNIKLEHRVNRLISKSADDWKPAFDSLNKQLKQDLEEIQKNKQARLNELKSSAERSNECKIEMDGVKERIIKSKGYKLLSQLGFLVCFFFPIIIGCVFKDDLEWKLIFTGIALCFHIFIIILDLVKSKFYFDYFDYFHLRLKDA
jgi:Fe-S-cluster containining protein